MAKFPQFHLKSKYLNISRCIFWIFLAGKLWSFLWPDYRLCSRGHHVGWQIHRFRYHSNRIIISGHEGPSWPYRAIRFSSWFLVVETNEFICGIKNAQVFLWWWFHTVKTNNFFLKNGWIFLRRTIRSRKIKLVFNFFIFCKFWNLARLLLKFFSNTMIIFMKTQLHLW